MFGLEDLEGLDIAELKKDVDNNECEVGLSLEIFKDMRKHGVPFTDGVNNFLDYFTDADDEYGLIYKVGDRTEVAYKTSLMLTAIEERKNDTGNANFDMKNPIKVPVFSLCCEKDIRTLKFNSNVFVAKPFYGHAIKPFNVNKTEGVCFIYDINKHQYVMRKFWKLNAEKYYVNDFGTMSKSTIKKLFIV